MRLDLPSYHNNGDKESLSVLSFDRIENIELQQDKFTVIPEFDPAVFFNECFGIVVGDGTKPERIILRTCVCPLF